MSKFEENNLIKHIDMMRKSADKLVHGSLEWVYINGLMIDLKVELKELQYGK
jgi:hypothetical protein